NDNEWTFLRHAPREPISNHNGASRYTPAEPRTMQTHHGADPGPSPALSPADLAQCLGVSSRTIRRWISLGTLPPPTRMTQRTFRWPASVLGEIFKARRG